MADFSADNAADSFSEDVNRIDGELQNDELLNWMPDFSQQSSAESLHSGQSPENVPCGPPPYCSYWGFETPGPSSDYTQAVLNALLTPPDSPHPLPRLVGYAEFWKS
ncbi:hypothetical protein WMY93_031026 [Mugilogobius chulae]|uniref:Uncharacterized protein n=1 Tax=Mugilogobius chulae TaxID=88201 RepID=A0AAW0MNW3_9GOBI